MIFFLPPAAANSARQVRWAGGAFAVLFLAGPARLFAETTTSAPAVELSPFVIVESSDDTGYYAENTLAGSRLSSNLGDLAAAITVVTRRQLTDTAARDVNDIFLYEANTEGTGNYTAYVIDRNGGVADLGANGPATSNRVRGLTAANPFRDYYPSIGRLPLDTYNTESVEISRGPNAILYGLGAASGIVNQSSARADIYASRGTISLRADTAGGSRASVTANRVLRPGVLGFYFAALEDRRGYSRQPAYDITHRQYAAVTFQPRAHTTLRASVEHFANRNRRPNNVTPRDLVTPWIQAGRPGWDPLNRTITVNGGTRGPFDTAAALAAFTPAVLDDNTTFPVFLTDRGTDTAWVLRQVDLPGGVPNEARLTRSSGAFAQTANFPLYVQPALSDRSLYDWENINAVSGNFGSSRALTYQIEFEQRLRPDLYLQLGWFTEDFAATTDSYLGQQTGVTLYADPNTRLLDGTPNPFFGAPFVEYFQPDRLQQPERNENWRATLVWELNFERESGWRALLGRHRLMGLGTRRDDHAASHRFREVVVSRETFTAVPPTSVWTNNTVQNSIYRRFYLGDSTGVVTRDPGLFPNGPLEASLRAFNPTTSQWFDEPVSLDSRLHTVSSLAHQQTMSGAFVLQSFLWKDRAVITAGWRRDRDENTSDLNRPVDPSTGFSDAKSPYVTRTRQLTSGNSTTAGIVLKPLDWLSVHANRATGFIPSGLALDLFARAVPVPTSRGTDVGVRVSLLDNRLVAGVNFFQTLVRDVRGSSGTAPTRAITMDATTFASWADGLVKSRLGAAVPADVLAAEVAQILQLPPGWIPAKQGAAVAATQTNQARGMEFQLLFTPTNHWTLKMTGGKQQMTPTHILPEWDDWIALRLPVWQKAVDDRGVSFWSGATGQVGANGGPGVSGLAVASQTPAQYWLANVEPPLRLARAKEGKMATDEREWRWNLLTNYEFTAGRWRGLSLGGAIRWEGRTTLGYRGAATDADGVLRQLDASRPIYDRAATHVDVWLAYTMRLPGAGDRGRQLKIQLNLRDAGERPKLLPVAANPDGTPSVFRITDGQIATLTTTLTF